MQPLLLSKIDRLVDELNALSHPTIEVRLDKHTDHSHAVEIFGDLLDKRFGGVIGDISRDLVWQFDQVTHRGLHLDPSARWQRFGKAFEAYSVSVYLKYRFTSVVLEAQEIGSYVRATSGYTFVGPNPAQTSFEIWDKSGRSQAMAVINEHINNPDNINVIEQMFEEVLSGARAPMQPRDIADLFRYDDWQDRDRRLTHLGKEILKNNPWIGRKVLGSL